MATQSTELEEAITNYFVAQYNEMHQKEIAEQEAKAEELKSKLAQKQPLPEAQADKIEQDKESASAAVAPEEEKKAE